MKPILFNTEMVRAILDGRKTVTRRVVKPQPKAALYPMPDSMCWPGCFANNEEDRIYRPPYQPGDILWVRETFRKVRIKHPGRAVPDDYQEFQYEYKADGDILNSDGTPVKWRSPYHMPREAARLFLRVTAVRAERLRDIFKDPPGPENQVVREGLKYGCDFIATWENTIKPKERTTYGWEANPWVWVIEFERISKEDNHEE